jgi:hypothetical protein
MTKIRDGRYDMTFGTIIGTGTAVLRLCDGQLSGRSKIGSLISGAYQYVPSRGLYRFDCNVDAAPNSFSFFGFFIGDRGRRFTASGEATVAGDEIRFSVGVIGRAVDVSLRYAGPLTEVI